MVGADDVAHELLLGGSIGRGGRSSRRHVTVALLEFQGRDGARTSQWFETWRGGLGSFRSHAAGERGLAHHVSLVLLKLLPDIRVVSLVTVGTRAGRRGRRLHLEVGGMELAHGVSERLGTGCTGKDVASHAQR